MIGKITSRKAAILFARATLAAAFLSAVADRLGLWGEKGTPGVDWGSPDAFAANVALLNPWLAGSMVPLVAWGVTIAEVVLAALLITGLFPRWTAVASGALHRIRYSQFVDAMYASFEQAVPEWGQCKARLRDAVEQH